MVTILLAFTRFKLSHQAPKIKIKNNESNFSKLQKMQVIFKFKDLYPTIMIYNLPLQHMHSFKAIKKFQVRLFCL